MGQFTSSNGHPYLFPDAASAEKLSTPLRIIHPGGMAESYYMAMPAASIIEKYPSFLLARPEVFRRPWDSIVKPDEMLTLGQKYLIVPRNTVKKLRKRVGSRSSILQAFSVNFDVSNLEAERSINQIEGNKVEITAGKKQVRFFGVETKVNSNSSEMVKEEKQQRRVKTLYTWQPSLSAIGENQGNDDD